VRIVMDFLALFPTGKMSNNTEGGEKEGRKGK